MKRIYLLLLALFSMTMGYAQQGAISGTVSDGDEPLIGASILVEGTTHGTVTDVEGKYQLTCPFQSKLILSCH